MFYFQNLLLILWALSFSRIGFASYLYDSTDFNGVHRFAQRIMVILSGEVLSNSQLTFIPFFPLASLVQPKTKMTQNLTEETWLIPTNDW